jgi:CheY-like chemotaxis protein
MVRIEPLSKPSMTRVLVIDDDQGIRDLLTAYLTIDGHECHTAANGFDGLNLLRSRPVDLVITDLVMKYDGMMTIRVIRWEFPQLKEAAMAQYKEWKPEALLIENFIYVLGLRPAFEMSISGSFVIDLSKQMLRTILKFKRRFKIQRKIASWRECMVPFPWQIHKVSPHLPYLAKP